ncbi:MAG: hypothetical protein K2H64_00970 [Desulfovibrio sp.]|nr:hypothetical protein [Desulfovibrio sp.]
MKYLNFAIFALALAIFPDVAKSASAPPPPGYEPSLAGDMAPGSVYPSQLPQYLPNGAVNLDEAWTQYGGARLYWNSVRIPKQLNLAGATWVDPALVPELNLQPQKTTVKKRVWRPAKRRVAVKKAVAKVKVPRRMTSRKLTTPAIPLPVAPVAPENNIAPLTAPGSMATTPIEPPRLQ